MLSLASLSRSVAIKIFRSAFKSGDYILTSLERLKNGPENHPGKKHIAQLLDRFELSGPNGQHLCLVHNALGECVTTPNRPDLSTWKSVKQIVEAIAYAHQVGVAHGGE